MGLYVIILGMIFFFSILAYLLWGMYKLTKDEK